MPRSLTTLLALMAVLPMQEQLPRPADTDMTSVVVTMTRENRCGFNLIVVQPVPATDRSYLDVCPDYTVTIRGDGRVTYAGRSGVMTVGERTHSVPADAVRALLAEFDRARFLELEAEYSSLSCYGKTEIRDHTVVTTTTLHVGSRGKTVRHQYGAPDALLRLEAQIDEFSGARRLTGREPTPTTSSASVSGTVKDEAGQPLVRAAVRVSLPPESAWSTSATTDDRGRYRIDGLCPLLYQIDSDVPGYAAESGSVLLHYGQTAVHDVVMRRRGAPATSEVIPSRPFVPKR